MIEAEEDEVPGTYRRAYPTYKSIHSIRGYEQNGIYVDWVVFEAHDAVEEEVDAINKDKATLYWAADEVNWYLVKQSKGKILILD